MQNYLLVATDDVAIAIFFFFDNWMRETRGNAGLVEVGSFAW